MDAARAKACRVLVRTSRVGCITEVELRTYLRGMKEDMREQAAAAAALAVECLPEWRDYLYGPRHVRHDAARII